MDYAVSLMAKSNFSQEQEKVGILSNREKVNEYKGGGSRIFSYWITVLAVSAPFIYFITRYAERFNLGKLEVVITSSLLGILALLFPYSMQKGQVLIWGLLSGGILICPWGIAVIRSRMIMNKAIPMQEIKNTIDVVASIEMEETIDVIRSIEGIAPLDKVACSDVVSPEVEEFSLEEIVEKGFQAKEKGNYHLAAEWFIYALDRRPSYDIAFYLIIESYWHWKTGYSTIEALNKVRPYINDYIKDAPSEWRMKLTAWLEEEKVINEL